jgi:hypothetical protein
MQLLKKQIPIAIAFVMGVVLFFQTFIPTRLSNNFLTGVLQWDRVIAGFAMLLGIYSLLNHHYHKLRRRSPGWGFSVVVYVGFFAMTIAGFVWGIINDQQITVAQAGGTYQVQVYKPFMWIYEFMFVPMQATMFSILAFYISSAAYRAFRARTKEATVLLVTAIIVMLGRVPLGAQLLPMKWLGGETEVLAGFTDWILNNPSMAAQRGIMIGIGLGVIATSLRIIFGIERTYMGGGE